MANGYRIKIGETANLIMEVLAMAMGRSKRTQQVLVDGLVLVNGMMLGLK